MDHLSHDFYKNLNAELQKPNKYFCEPKNNKRSEEYRQYGNNCFAKNTNSDYLDALNYYNKSICFAEKGSEHLSIGYANRSAIYLELKLFDVCLKNIEMARNAGGYPARLMEKLNNREAKCKELMKAEKRKPKMKQLLVPQLSFPPHKNVPFIANCLELRKNETYGRHVVTNRDLKVGQIIAIEEPFCSAVPILKQYERCDNCTKEKARSLIPCKGCTFVMFCDEKCYLEAMRRWHKFECPVINYIFRMGPQQLWWFALRVTLCAVTSFNSLQELQVFMTETKGQDLNVFNTTYSSQKGDNRRYEPISSMQKESLTEMHKSEIIMISYVIMVMLNKTELNIPVETIMELLVHTVEIYRLNSSRRADISQFTEEGMLRDNRIVELLPFRSLISHSCMPNICFTSFDNKTIVSARVPIRAGEQLFDCYGAMHIRMPIQLRRAHLPFECTCPACIKNYPLEENFPVAKIPFAEVPMLQLAGYDRNVAIESLPVLSKYIRQYIQHYPCLQISTALRFRSLAMAISYCDDLPLNMMLEKPYI